MIRYRAHRDHIDRVDSDRSWIRDENRVHESIQLLSPIMNEENAYSWLPVKNIIKKSRSSQARVDTTRYVRGVGGFENAKAMFSGPWA
jgi:hypothetical protein